MLVMVIDSADYPFGLNLGLLNNELNVDNNISITKVIDYTHC